MMPGFKPSKHSSKLEITGSSSKLLSGKRIVIGLTGSVAISEMVNLIRLLMRNGAEVFAAMTPAAIELIHPNLIEWATGNPVITELTGQIEHVHLCGKHPDKADLLLIAPCTANTIGKIASGIDDTVVTTFISTALGTEIPKAIVPAMHSSMYDNPIVIKNIEYLHSIGIHFISPRREEGKAKIAKNEEILEKIIKMLTPNDYAWKKVVVTAGATRIWIDDTRFISNPSTGKMGIDIALEAASRGADVTILLGPTSLEITNSDIKVIPIATPEDIIYAIDQISEIDVFISAAAIGDYQPEKHEGKIASKQDELTLTLKPTPKIIDYVRKRHPSSTIAGFKAEVKITEDELLNRALKSLREHKIDLVVANFLDKPDQGFASDTNKVLIVKKDKKHLNISLESKRMIAGKILDELIIK